MKYKLFIDLETTSLNAQDTINKDNIYIPASGILEIYAELYIQNKLIDTFHSRALPNDDQVKHAYNKELISKNISDKVTTTQTTQNMSFLSFLRKHIDPYDQFSKAAFIAYNAPFDESFVREILKSANLNWGNFFLQKSICLYELSSYLLGDTSIVLKDNKLCTVARYFNIPINKKSLHNADYDIYLTKLLWNELNSRMNMSSYIIEL
jgi:DNA polymerase III epsilon subunit-like protein